MDRFRFGGIILDMSIGEYFQQFAFIEEQLQKFIKTAEERNFANQPVLMM